jgi:hypothetical protein
MQNLPLLLAAAALAAASAACQSECYSPFNLPSGDRGAFARSEGCACDETPASVSGYCLGRYAVTCERERWGGVEDGPCEPGGGTEYGWCAQSGGAVPATDVCPSGFHQDRPWSGTPNVEQRCCLPLQVTARDCRRAGFRVAQAEQSAELLSTRCSNGGILRAFVTAGPKPELCCD